LAQADVLDVSVAALDSAHELVFLLDAEQNVCRANRAAAERFSQNGEDILGRHCYEIVHGLSRPIPDCPHVAAMRRLQSSEAVFAEPHLGGTFAERCRPLLDGDEMAVGTVHVLAELTNLAGRDDETQRLRRRLAEALRTLGEAARLRDPVTAHHQRRVAQLARAVGAELRLDASSLEGLTVACQVHDIAKIGVPVDIIAKPGPLSANETAIVQMHVEGAARLLSEIPFEQPVVEIVWQHHERLDGSGYPRALHGDQLLLEARILAVADVVEAMVSERPYRRPLGMDAALGEVQAGAGTRYDAAVVAGCHRVVSRGFQFTA
jgi:HD-GYP domain-containing protein (c-di-GMP phosphodiesterase class II)